MAAVVEDYSSYGNHNGCYTIGIAFNRGYPLFVTGNGN